MSILKDKKKLKHALIFEPPRRVDDGDSQTKKNYSMFSWNFLLHRCPNDF